MIYGDGYSTRLFKDIFPNYATFSSWYENTPLPDNATEVPSEKTFTLIAYNFNGSHVAYGDLEFKQHFAITLYTYYKEFEETTAQLVKLMALADDEIRLEYANVTNIAEIPETTYSTDAETADFISQQQKNIAIKGTLQVRKEQLSNKRAFTVNTFLNRFKNLFIKILSPSYNALYEEIGE